MEKKFPCCRIFNTPKIKPLHIYENCVFMLLDRIDVSTSCGPDKLPGRLVQWLAKKSTPVVHYICTQSLCTDELPIENPTILTDPQHCFRSGRSRKTQLVTTFQ